MPPPLRSRDPDNHVPLRVFAFPLPRDRLIKWANMHNISPESEAYIRQQDAWEEIKRQRPQKALMIASNRSTKELAQAEDLDLIQQYRKLLNIEPGWFHVFR
ncbi:hypothetical protein AX14_004840 [Amanita brunnescens Koide BX004]|nr:hypothetical protein AX14_004840 [Amanita brunnescens Koide BX004]